MPKAEETILEIDLNALKNNFEYIKSKTQPNTKILAVVKAFAYGSDACTIAKYLEKLNVNYLAVAYASEGVALRNAGVITPILVLHPQAVNFNTLVERCLEPSIYSAKILDEFIAVASKAKQTNYPIHIKFNTGLNRLGFGETDVNTITSKLKNSSCVKVKSVFSHLAASEDLTEKQFTNTQIRTFKTIAADFSSQLGFQPMMHICNTSGLLNYPEAHFDMVRTGIGLYGFGNSEKEDKNFKPVATLKSVISQIHTIKKGESVGYNRAFKSNGDSKTATIPIGHADGIGRQYGNGRGFVTIQGEIAPIIGNVCMDMIMIDITNISCKEGDEVIVFGKQPTASAFASAINSISYEIITAISQRVKRCVIGN